MLVEIGHFDVIIVGAGPTGLTTALCLRQLGLSVCIVDKAPTALQIGRADALNARTQETLEVLGIISELESRGLKCNTSSTFTEGAFLSRQSHWWTSLTNIHRPNFLMIGQADIEKALNSKLDIQVRRNVDVIKVEETNAGTKLHCSTGILEGKYLVGADGARSLVREQLRIPFEGTKPEMVWAVLDTFLETDFPQCPEIVTFQSNGQSRVSWIPRERGMARFYVLLDGEITQAKTEAKIREVMIPYRVDFIRTEWFSTFEIKERVVKTVFSPNKRIIFAGDAAHIHAVNGGQGLNTGIADAFALAWRLALATKGHTKALESYEIERLGAAKQVVDIAAKLVRSTTKTAKEYVDLIEANAAYITGAGVRYTSGQSLAVQGTEADLFIAGSRCPDLYFHDATGPDDSGRRLYTMVAYGKFLFLYSSVARQCCSKLSPSLEAYRECWVVGQDRVLDQESVSMDDERPSEKRFRAVRSDNDSKEVVLGMNVVVVRPDMYVGYVGSCPEEYFRNLLA